MAKETRLFSVQVELNDRDFEDVFRVYMKHERGSEKKIGLLTSIGLFAVCIVLIYLILRSSFATVLKGSRDNLERLTFVGMNTRNVKLYACMISSFFVTIAGILYAMRNMGAFPVMMSTNTSTEGLVMCLIGGMYSFFGPILGAVIVTIINVLLPNMTRYYQFVLGIIIVLCVLFLQGGLLRDKATKDLEEHLDFEHKEEAGQI